MHTLKHLLSCSLLLIATGCGSSSKSSSYSNDPVVNNNPPARRAAEPVPTPAKTGSNFNGSTANSNDPKNYSALQVKYAGYLRTTPDEITNLRLYKFIDEWLGTPYLWGGTTRNGIDCSAFVQKLVNYVYEVNVPRTSITQFYSGWVELFWGTEYLSEGDFIFFRTNKSKLVSHIGLYLKNGMFVNSSSKGVSIASLYDPYWKKVYVSAGRIKMSMLEKYK